ncbi:MAG: hypothetical protein IKG51_01465 [Firmicutes bacterium]|nr:hypothetical protein [Bacillota bacterium]
MGTKVKRQYYSPESDGFYGAFYACPSSSEKAMILMLGDAIDDRMAISGVKWLHQQGCHVMAMSPDKKDYGHHNFEDDICNFKGRSRFLINR